MIISYLGHSCLLVTAQDKKILFDPFDPKMVGLPLKKQSCDYCCITHGHADHNYIAAAKGAEIIDSVINLSENGIDIEAFPSFHDNVKGLKRGKNTVFKLTSDSYSFAHLGDIGFIDYELIKHIKGVDILALPVGGNYTIDAYAAAEYVTEIAPKFVIPIHYHVPGSKIDIAPPEPFLKLFKEYKFIKTDNFDTDSVPSSDKPTIVMLNIRK